MHWLEKEYRNDSLNKVLFAEKNMNALIVYPSSIRLL